MAASTPIGSNNIWNPGTPSTPPAGNYGGFSNNGPYGNVQAQVLPAGNQLAQQYSSPENQTRLNALPSVQNNSILSALMKYKQATNPDIAGFNKDLKGNLLQQGFTNVLFQTKQQDLANTLQNTLQNSDINRAEAARFAQYGNELNQAAQQHFVAQSQQANTQYDTNLRQLYSDATANGAITTQGVRANRTGLAQQLYEAVREAGASKAEAQARGNYYLNNAAIENMRANQSDQSAETTFKNNIAQLAASHGLDLEKLIDAANSTDASRAAAAQSVVDQLNGLAQENPALLQMFGLQPGQGMNYLTGLAQQYGIGPFSQATPTQTFNPNAQQRVRRF